MPIYDGRGGTRMAEWPCTNNTSADRLIYKLTLDPWRQCAARE